MNAPKFNRTQKGSEVDSSVDDLDREIAVEERAFARQMALPGGMIVGITFALVLAAAALFMSYKMLVRTAEYLSMRNWVPVSAELTSFELGRNDRYTTVSVKYRYRHGEKECLGTRVNISRSAGIDYADTLGNAYKTRIPVTVWVNPNRLCNAVIDRSLDIFEIILVSLGVIAIAWIILYIRGKSWKLV